MEEAPVRLLVIDDSDDDRDLYRRCLRKSGVNAYDIQEAADGEQGLIMTQSQHFDCVLLDYSLPGRNGIEILKRIRAKDTYLPIIMLTGQGNETVAVSAMKEGAQDYIAKSTITPEALERMVRVAIMHGAMQRRIQEQRSSLKIFSYALAHDLREPTNTIRTFIELILKRESLSYKGHSYITHVQKAADRMLRLIDTVYLFARLDAPEYRDEMEACELDEIFAEVEANLGQLMQTEDILLTSAPLPKVMANRVQLLQVFQNLISNAVRHGGKDVAIHIGAQQHEGYWQFAVSDTGPGIEPEHMEAVFEPFKRMSSPDAERGLGLGLAVCRKIIERHGGKIWCESTLGQGTSFYFTLPIRSENSTNADMKNNTEHALDNESRGNIARILMVDDNEADLTLNRILLTEQTKMHCEIITAKNGREALDRIEEANAENNPVDLVLLDINMPVMNGFEMLSKMTVNGRLNDMTVVMCSTSSYDIDKRMANSMGASGYLTKPLQFPQFKAILEKNARIRLANDGENYTLLRQQQAS